MSKEKIENNEYLPEKVEKRALVEKVFLGICSIWWREEEGKISRWNCLSYTRHVTYLNLIGQTNASIETVPGTSQPQRNTTCAPRLDINYIMSRHNVWLFDTMPVSGFRSRFPINETGLCKW